MNTSTVKIIDSYRWTDYDETPEEIATLPTSELPAEVIDAVHSAARGSYQQGLIDGIENWSGSSLKGKASSYGARYAESREGLLLRIQCALPAGYTARTKLVCSGSPKRWRRELVIYAPDGVHVW